MDESTRRQQSVTLRHDVSRETKKFSHSDVRSSLPRYRFDQLSGRFGGDFAILKNRLPAQDGAADFSCQRAADVWTLAMSVEQFIASHFVRLLQVDQRKVRIRAYRETSFF